MVPRIDVAPLLGPASAARDAVDGAVLAAAAGTGFMVVRGLPAGPPLDAATRARLRCWRTRRLRARARTCGTP